MTDHRGGHRTPSKPAPVSGPGRLSKRTDGGPTQKVRDLTGGQYGEGSQFKQLEQSAPMAAGDVPPPSGQPAPAAGPPVDVTPFHAPTQNPQEPVTAGNPMGAGVGPAAMGLQDPRMQDDQADARRLLPYLPALEFMANQAGASNAMRSMVRQVKALNA